MELSLHREFIGDRTGIERQSLRNAVFLMTIIKVSLLRKKPGGIL